MSRNTKRARATSTFVFGARMLAIVLLLCAPLASLPYALAQSTPNTTHSSFALSSIPPSSGVVTNNDNGTTQGGGSGGSNSTATTGGTSKDNGTSPLYAVQPSPPVPVPAGATWKHWSKADPNDPNALVNFTGSTTTIYVDLTNTAYNDLAGSSCANPACTPNNGQFSYQWNIVFPTDSNFMIQAVIEFDTVSNSCYAHAQSSTGSPSTSTYSFSCSSLTAPGDNFEWIVITTSSDF